MTKSIKEEIEFLDDCIKKLREQLINAHPKEAEFIKAKIKYFQKVKAGLISRYFPKPKKEIKKVSIEKAKEEIKG
jgi:hypothetical protein